ncbi:DUF4234 domain-containing protein [Gordonia desulfuricans]|uniref:DUF4234 domain-containing protein n=1 Tax=Gordonia desulfuricans TaxID=89051 RepID=UPI001FD3DD70|nr:DUF4234 domain-containing protein [Gordonia desulfuricans]
MSTPQNPEDEQRPAGPSEAATRLNQKVTPPTPIPPQLPPDAASEAKTEFVSRPAPPPPSAAPTAVYTKTGVPADAPRHAEPPRHQPSPQQPPRYQAPQHEAPQHQAPQHQGPQGQPPQGFQPGPPPQFRPGPPPHFQPGPPPSGPASGAPAPGAPAPGASVPNVPAPHVPPPSDGVPAHLASQQPAPGAGRPVADGLSMKHRNPLGVWIGLPLITFGIYGLVWYYKIHKEMAQFDPRKEIPVAGPLLVIIFLGWTIIAPIISYNNAGKRIRDAQRAAGLPETCNPLLCWLLMFAFGLHTWYMQTELNKVVDRYGVEPGTQVPLFV